MRKRKQRPTDLTYQNLPQNRKEAFFDIWKTNWRAMFLITLTILITMLPILIGLFMQDSIIGSINDQMSKDPLDIKEGTSNICFVSLITSLIVWLYLYIACIPLSVITRMLRQLSWYEPIFVKEDILLGIKNNYKSAAISSTFIGIILVISKLTLYINMNPFIQAIPLGIFVAILLPPIILTYLQSNIYNGKYFSLLKNGIIMYIKSFPLTILIILLIVSPVLFNLIDSLIFLKYGLLVGAIILLEPSLFLILHLYTNKIFDKYINEHNFKELVNKGLFKQ